MRKRAFTTKDIQRAVEQQGHQCPYCTLPFGSLVKYRGETVQTPVGDHFAPYSWNRETNVDNLIASCQVCNSLKSDKLFESVDQARRFLLVERMTRGIVTYFIPSVALTEDAEAWNSEYLHWFSSEF